MRQYHRDVVTRGRAHIFGNVEPGTPEARRSPVPVAGLLLAGGRGQRVGGRDKGLLRYRGRPLAAHVLTRLAPYCSELLVSANRNRSRYRLLANRVIADRLPGYPGPLAGLAAGLTTQHAPLWLVCPCDVPDLPVDVPERLLRALRLNGGVEVAVLHDIERLQPLVLALRGHLGGNIRAYLDAGGRSVRGWLEQTPVAVVYTRERLSNWNWRGRGTDTGGPDVV